jgi:acetyl esterase/lipase
MRACLPPLLMAIFLTHIAQAQTVVPLWPGPAPGSLGSAPVDIPTLTLFLPAKPAKPPKPSPAVVICPGGGYGFVAGENEGADIAKWFQDRGVAAMVLEYRVPAHGYRHPVPLLDARRAIRLVRSHAADWNIDPARTGVMGFSAGGHVASTLETHFDAGDPKAGDPADRLGCRPDFAVLVYAVISMKDGIAHQGSKMNLLGPNPDPALVENLSNETQVTPQTPPTLLIHAQDDNVVPIKNSRLMYAALQKAGVVSAIQEYPHGGHGFGFGTGNPATPPGWLDHAGEWLKEHGFMP